MTFSQLVDIGFPLLMGFGGLYLVLHSKHKTRQRNRELEQSWQANKKDGTDE